SRIASARVAEESCTRIARWGDADYSVVLYRSSYASGFRMIVTSVRPDALARTAEAQAVRLDERDAPRREIARQKKEADETRAAQEKARLANKIGKHTSELQSRFDLVCRLLLEKKKTEIKPSPKRATTCTCYY